ncbi:Tm-1-like ATP-binding domain-containing protein [Arthrobacter sp. NPDC058288]|uniref:Tm-1-like ATP-binding domain-containing protein n=1 Tax=Arthrobacter sp. NPDC058288 TaxID=3346424 RepID=UPI0036E9C533
MPTAVLIGTLDTKGREYAFVQERLHGAGIDVVIIDVSILGTTPGFAPDVTAEEVCEAGGARLEDLRFAREGTDTRAVAIETMTRGAACLLRKLVDEGRCDGVLGLGGSGGSALISGAMRALPLGVPKILVSTMASGDVSAYVGSSDLCIMHSVTDIAGLNRISKPILANAAGALAGMLTSKKHSVLTQPEKPAVGVTMLGVTTPGVLRVIERLEAAGFEPIVFHAVGSGGKALENLLEQGVITGVVDYTVKELTDETYGGIFRAGPDRLRTAGRKGFPQVVVPGAIEVLNFGALANVPPEFSDGSRPIVQHNAEVTAVRINTDELVNVAGILAQRLNQSTGPTCVVIPSKGFDSYAVEGGPFADPAADESFIHELERRLRPDIEVATAATHGNDPAFADLVADAFIRISHPAQQQ